MTGTPVKPPTPRHKPLRSGAHGDCTPPDPPVCPCPRVRGTLDPRFPLVGAVNVSLLTVLGLALVAAILLFIIVAARRRASRRHREIRQLLDAADALEARLRTARSEIEAVAGDHIDDPVHDALREMLRQRLWLREHGDTASVDELQQVRGSIVDARSRIEQQLDRIERARVPVV